MSKRAFDLFGASILFLVTLPFWPLIALAVHFGVHGPVFFTQRRVGYRGREFSLLKFSTLAPGKAFPERIILPGDERITPTARFLRSTHLDELPQLINVLRGEMSLVGPRPLPLDFMQDFMWTKNYIRRHSVRPGLTGPAQLKGRMWWVERGMQSVFRLDAWYTGRCCLMLDCRILLATIGVVFRREGI